MSQITFDYFKVPDPLDNVQALADEMTYLGLCPERYPKLLIDTYEETIIEKIDMKQVVEIFDHLTYDNSKVMISGKRVLERPEFEGTDVKEKWMKTKYRLINKPALPSID